MCRNKLNISMGQVLLEPFSCVLQVKLSSWPSILRLDTWKIQVEAFWSALVVYPLVAMIREQLRNHFHHSLNQSRQVVKIYLALPVNFVTSQVLPKLMVTELFVLF